MYGNLLALGVGLGLLRFLPAPIPESVVMYVPLSLSLVGWRWSRWLALCACGVAWASLQAHGALDARLAEKWDGETFWLEGVVVGLPESQEEGTRFELAEVQSRYEGIPQHLMLFWRDAPPLQTGERWRLAARLKTPKGLSNPAGFDREAWLLAKGIGATGSVKAGSRLEGAAGSATWRGQLKQHLLNTEAQGQAGALLALVLGDGSALSRATWQVLQDTGTVHLLVISGQHISLLAGLVFIMVAGLACWGVWPVGLPWLPVACSAALLTALGYGWLAGFDIPVQRACLMVAMVLIWRWRFRQLSPWLGLLVAWDAVLLWDPLATLRPGFWLSFGAVACLLWVFSGRLGAWSGMGSWVRAQWAMTLGLLPFLLALGIPISVTAPIANLVAVPWVSILVLPLALLGTLCLPIFGLGAALLQAAGYALAWLFEVLTWMSHWQQAQLFPMPSGFSGYALCLGIGLMLLPAGVPCRALGILLCFPLYWSALPQIPAGEASVRVLDVGQGLSVLVQTAHHDLVYDTGPAQGEFDAGGQVLLPVLAQLRVRHLDALILSHEDSDHAGGAATLQKAFSIPLKISGTQGSLAKQWNMSACVSGTRWVWDDVQFSLWRWDQAKTDNQASCVLLIEAGGERLLLTGDIDAQAEAALLAEPSFHPVDWLILGHHGSRSSSSEDFLQATAPRAAVITRGHNNQFGHPHPQVLERLKARDIPWVDTSERGAVEVFLGRFTQPQLWRQQAKGFWLYP